MIPAYDPDIARKTPDGKRMLTHALTLVNDIAAPMCDPAANLGARCSTDWRRVNCPHCRTAGKQARTGPDEYQEYLVGGPHHGETIPDGLDNDTIWLRKTSTNYAPGNIIEVHETTYHRRSLGAFGQGLTIWVAKQTGDKEAHLRLGDILLAPHRRPAPPKGPDRV